MRPPRHFVCQLHTFHQLALVMLCAQMHNLHSNFPAKKSFGVKIDMSDAVYSSSREWIYIFIYSLTHTDQVCHKTTLV